tara:strand:+ start:13 stop:285 length:273 start_codon:yes stop_codon:yes gene_type:complete
MTTKADIVKQIYKGLDIDQSSSKKLLEKFIQLIINNSHKKTTKISGFGSFEYRKTAKRIGRNPKSKESYIIYPMNKLFFRPSNQLRKTIN